MEKEFDQYIEEHFGEPWDGCVPVGCFELSQMAEHFYALGKKETIGKAVDVLLHYLPPVIIPMQYIALFKKKMESDKLV